MIAHLSSAAAGFLMLKSSLLLAFGWCVTRLMRRASASSRHLVWLTVIVGVLFMPIVGALARVPLRVLPAETRVSSTPPTLTAADRQPQPREQIVVAPMNGVPDRVQRASGNRPIDLGRTLLAVWAVASFVLSLRLIVGMVSVGRLARRGRRLEKPEWQRVLADAASRLDVSTMPRLIMSDQVETAFAFHATSPAIILPASAREWSADRRRAVLLHELAHIQRRDLVSHTIAGLACAVNWYNPFIWAAARQLRLESEMASDEIVLRAGIQPSVYAQHLLDMAIGFGRRAPSVALAMARPGEFEGRLVAILDPERRHPLLAGRRGSLVALVALPALAIGAVAPAPRAPEITPAPVRRLVPHPYADSAGIPMTPARRSPMPARPRIPSLAPVLSTRKQPAVDTTAGDSARTAAPSPASTDSPFEVLFSGIALTPEQATYAHALLDSLQAAQLAQTTNTMKRLQESLPQRRVLFEQFDSTLLSVPTNAADVATLRARLPQPVAPDGRIGELGAGYARLFDGIALSPDQEAAARAAISKFQQDIRALNPRPDPPIVGIRRNPTRVVLRPASDSAFRALVSSDADRAALQSRINVVHPPPRPPN